MTLTCSSRRSKRARWTLGLCCAWIATAALAHAPVAHAATDTPSLHAGNPVRVNGLRLTGLQRTDLTWLENYVGYVWPARLGQQDIAAIVRKLLTTAVYSAVTATLEPDPQGPPGDAILHIDVIEKWTTIPVVRGAIGGGTPLRVFGIYDTHAFGRLVTVGAETHQYGDAPPGAVAFMRVPRFDGGRWFLAADVWREFRRRSIYDPGSVEPRGVIGTSTSIARFAALGPLEDGDLVHGIHHRAGVDVAVLQEAPVVYDPRAGADPQPPDDLVLPADKTTLGKLLPTYLYDAVAIDNILYEGARFVVRGGPLLVSGDATRHSVGELETYHYSLLPNGLNSAVRAFVGTSTYVSPRSQYFLGGLDTVRGLPDGAIYGTKAVYVNAELRHLSLRSEYLWVQSLAFLDSGAAANSWDELGSRKRACAGVGLRFAVPQVTRLMFRLDYAWAVDGTESRGITAGLNQFFDPYRPL